MIKYLILDIDGTLTDGGVYYDNTGNELKKFNTKDGTGIILTRIAGIQPIVLTGRECQATLRRMTELGVTAIHQNVKNKSEWLKAWMVENEIQKDEIAYLGDDVNDIPPMKLCGFVACPADAVEEVKSIAGYVSTIPGGHGVVRDVIRFLLDQEGLWNEVLNKAYGVGVELFQQTDRAGV